MPTGLKRPPTDKTAASPTSKPRSPRYRRGQLVINHSFEASPPLLGWRKNEGVDLIFSSEYDVHSGLAAVRLGHIKPQARLVQIISGIIPGKYYQLSFFLQSVHANDNAPLWVKLDFLDAKKQLIEPNALKMMVDQLCLNDIAYTGYIEFTTVPAPSNARYARLMVEIDTSRHSQGAVLLDDITMIAIA